MWSGKLECKYSDLLKCHYCALAWNYCDLGLRDKTGREQLLVTPMCPTAYGRRVDGMLLNILIEPGYERDGAVDSRSGWLGLSS